MYKNKSIHKLRKANTKIIKRRNQTVDARSEKKGGGGRAARAGAQISTALHSLTKF
jgi:nanoRNase/pAp phosphatase (c-di-AMP/oligoRNAs hydrolase)